MARPRKNTEDPRESLDGKPPEQAPKGPDAEMSASQAEGQVAPSATYPDEDLPTGSGLLVTVTGPKQGRWRAGRRFGAAAVTICLDDLTQDERAALANDPRLRIVVTQEA